MSLSKQINDNKNIIVVAGKQIQKKMQF